MKPTWVLDSVAANKLLSCKFFLVSFYMHLLILIQKAVNFDNSLVV